MYIDSAYDRDSHQTFSSQLWSLTGQTQFDPTHLLCNINESSIDVLPSKNQSLCEYCTHVSSYQLS